MVGLVENRKEWVGDFWYYHMRRFHKGRHYSICLCITKYDMHRRDLVAYKLRNARRELRRAIKRSEWDAKFT